MLIIAGLIGWIFMGFGVYWLYSLVRSKFDQNYKPLLKPWMSFSITAVALVAALVVVAKSPGVVSSANSLSSSSLIQTQQRAVEKITMEKFKQLQTGMSYQQVVAILGREGEELSRNDIGGYTTIMYQWTEGFSNMNAMFQNDRLVQKAQLGLKQ